MASLIDYLRAWGLNDWDPWTFLTIVLMACITVITRSFFFISDAPWTLPSWAQRGMQLHRSRHWLQWSCRKF